VPQALRDATGSCLTEISTISEQFAFTRDPVIGSALLRLRSHAPDAPVAHARGVKPQRLFWARNGLYHALDSLGIAGNDRVLVPAYICKSAVQPFAGRGIACDLYRIDRDCRTDLTDVERRIGPNTRAILVVHYFGFPQPIAALRALCDKHRLLLIEDCAHVLTGTADGKLLGSHGDAAVFSWRKFLPLYDGATLFLPSTATARIPLAKERAVFTAKVGLNLVQSAAEHPDSWFFSGLYRLLRLARRAAPSAAANAAASQQSVDSGGMDFDTSTANLPMSRLSRFVFEHSDVDGIVAARRERYAKLSQLLSSNPRVRMLWPTLPDDVCPWILPCFLGDRDDIHVELRRRGIPAATWGGVIPDLDLSAQPDAEFLYRRLVFLPVHQSVPLKDLERIASEVSSLV
jgi:perosamine synthetase